MISLDAFLVFLGAASLPATYLMLVRHWLEHESQPASPGQPAREARPAGHHRGLGKPRHAGH